MTSHRDDRVRLAEPGDAEAAAGLMHRFENEFEGDIDEPEVLAVRYREQMASGLIVLFGGDGPDGFAQLRLQGQIYSDAPSAYLEELYVVPERRGEGLGRALLEAAIEEARRRGADHIDVNTAEDDTEARALYASAGFTDREGRPDGPVMLYYEREL